MYTNQSRRLVARVSTVVALLASLGTVAAAQKPSGPPVTTKGAVKSNPKADKGQATAEASRTKAREEKAEKNATELARKEPKSLLRGVKLTDAQETSTKAIEKKYAEQFKALAKTDKADEKAGTEDADYIAKVEALRLQERAELRASLTPEQQVKFDANVAAIGTKKANDKK